MQYVAGESLQDRLDRTGPLEVAEIVRIGLQTAAGLAAAHAQGLIHRDIKPANLLLENGLARVKITDFGLARMADDVGLTQNGVVAGTPEYMAPEQARGEPVDHRADLFSLGSVLYAMCTGVAAVPRRDRAGRAPPGQRRGAGADPLAEPGRARLAGDVHRPAAGEGPGRALPDRRRGGRPAGGLSRPPAPADDRSGPGAAVPADR